MKDDMVSDYNAIGGKEWRDTNVCVGCVCVCVCVGVWDVSRR